MKIIKRILTYPLIAVAAILMLFEEWLWHRLIKLGDRLARLAVIARIEAWIATLPPYGALAFFLVPALTLFPVKIAALYLLAHGHGFIGIAFIALAKVIGTAWAARIYHLTTTHNIWIFDEEDYKLKKIDEEGKMLFETTGWRLLFDSVPSPTQLIDRDNFVYIYDPEKGFYIFDYYGSFKNRLAFLNWTNVEVNGKTMYGFGNNKLYSYELKSLNLKEYKLPDFFGNFTSIKAMNGKIYLLNENGITIYQIK